jgi:hypothetical protein
MKYASYAGALPISKRLIGVPVVGDASSFTNPISLAGHKYARGANLSSRVRLPGFTPTVRVFGLLGRVNVVGAVAFGAYDVYSIGTCMLDG